MHLTILFVVIGISADDIFVFMDAWRQSATLVPSIMGESDYEKRMAYSFRRAFRAMMFTSTTTSLAFFSNYFSPVMVMKSLGLFAATIVMVNFYQAVIVFPTAIIIYELKIKANWRDCSKAIRCKSI